MAFNENRRSVKSVSAQHNPTFENTHKLIVWRSSWVENQTT